MVCKQQLAPLERNIIMIKTNYTLPVVDVRHCRMGMKSIFNMQMIMQILDMIHYIKKHMSKFSNVGTTIPAHHIVPCSTYVQKRMS
jgi:hypothetical protein